MGTARTKDPASLYVFIDVITVDCDNNGGREHRPLVVHSGDFRTLGWEKHCLNIALLVRQRGGVQRKVHRAAAGV